MASPRGKEFVFSQGVGQSTGNATIIAAPGADHYLHLEQAVVSVYVASVSSNGIVALEDGNGGTKIWQANSAAVGTHIIPLGERGYRLTANTLLNLTVEGTTVASAHCAAIAHVAPDGY